MAMHSFSPANGFGANNLAAGLSQNPYSGVNPATAIGGRGWPKSIESKPASVYRQRSGSRQDHDPSADIPGMPPNMGENLLPHVVTFQGILASVSRVYRPSDEALKDSFDNARFMINDPVLMECVDQRRRSVALLNWHLEPEDERDPKQKQLADEITQIIKRIPHFKKYRETLHWAIWYGRYANQHRYRWKNVRGQMRLCIDQWLPINGDKLVFRYDDGQMEYDPNQIGIRVGAGFTTSHTVQKTWSVERLNKVQPTDYGLAYFLEEWERPQICVQKYLIEDGEYEDPMNAGRVHGVGIRSRLYWAWYQKQETLAWLQEYLERSALGMEIWYYPWGNANAKQEAMTAAQERIGQGRNIVLVPRPMGEPEMYGVERIEPGMAGAEVLLKMVNEYWGHLMKRVILGQTMTTESANSGLGSNLGDIHLDTYMQIVRSDAIDQEETLTSDLVEPLKIFNRPDMASVPLYFRIDTEAPDVERKLAAYKDAYDMNLELVEQSVRDLIGAPKPEPGDKVLSKAQDAQADHDRQMQLQQAGRPLPGQPGGQPGDAKGRSQVAMPGQDFAELWDAFRRQAQVNSLQEELGIEADGHDTRRRYARQREDFVNPPSENSERQRLRTYAADGQGADLEEILDAIERAAAETDREPSEAQRKAGNYRKGKFSLQGFQIAIENPRGSVRRGVNDQGKAWESVMPHHYGYILRNVSEADGDHVDVFVGPDPDSELVFVVDQKNPKTGRFDEHKVMLGFKSQAAAKRAYLDAYQAGWQGFSEIHALTLAQFKAWLEDGETGRALARQVEPDRYSLAGKA